MIFGPLVIKLLIVPILNPDQITNLEQKRRYLQKKIQVKEDVTRLIEPWIEVYKKILQHGLDCRIEYLQCIDEEAMEPWIDALRNGPLAGLNFNAEAVLRKGKKCIQQQLEENFPGIYPLRYMPELTYRINFPETTARVILQNAMKSLGVVDEPVYIFFNRFSPVIKMNIADVPEITLHLTDLQEDLCIMAESGQWLIFRSLEDEWRWGYQDKQLALYAEGSRPLYIYSRTSSMSEMVRVLNVAAPVMEVSFDPAEIFTVMNKFLLSRADTSTHIVRGNEVWMEISFERHDGYLFWHCYTFDGNLVEKWKEFFSRL